MGLPFRFFEFKSLVASTAARYGYDAALLAAQAHQESGWNSEAVSSAGARGLMQFIGATWKDYGKGGDAFDPAASLDAGVRFMGDLSRKFGDTRLALAAYNAGPGRVAQAIKKAGSSSWEQVEKYLPNETRKYVPSILRLKSLYQTLGDLGTTLPIGMMLALAFTTVLIIRRLTV